MSRSCQFWYLVWSKSGHKSTSRFRDRVASYPTTDLLLYCHPFTLLDWTDFSALYSTVVYCTTLYSTLLECHALYLTVQYSNTNKQIIESHATDKAFISKPAPGLNLFESTGQDLNQWHFSMSLAHKVL